MSGDDWPQALTLSICCTFFLSFFSLSSADASPEHDPRRGLGSAGRRHPSDFVQRPEQQQTEHGNKQHCTDDDVHLHLTSVRPIWSTLGAGTILTWTSYTSPPFSFLPPFLFSSFTPFVTCKLNLNWPLDYLRWYFKQKQTPTLAHFFSSSTTTPNTHLLTHTHTPNTSANLTEELSLRFVSLYYSFSLSLSLWYNFLIFIFVRTFVNYFSSLSCLPFSFSFSFYWMIIATALAVSFIYLFTWIILSALTYLLLSLFSATHTCPQTSIFFPLILLSTLCFIVVNISTVRIEAFYVKWYFQTHLQPSPHLLPWKSRTLGRTISNTDQLQKSKTKFLILICMRGWSTL